MMYILPTKLFVNNVKINCLYLIHISSKYFCSCSCTKKQQNLILLETQCRKNTHFLFMNVKFQEKNYNYINLNIEYQIVICINEK